MVYTVLYPTNMMIEVKQKNSLACHDMGWKMELWNKKVEQPDAWTRVSGFTWYISLFKAEVHIDCKEKAVQISNIIN